MYARIAMLLLVAASAAACAQNDQLACREVQTVNGIKGPGCALDIAQSEGEAPKPHDVPQDKPNEPDPVPQ
jgi:hypothetical protein